MNYNDLILLFLLLLMIAYDHSSEDQKRLQEDLLSARKEVVLMRKELALAREETVRLENRIFRITDTANIAMKLNDIVDSATYR